MDFNESAPPSILEASRISEIPASVSVPAQSGPVDPDSVRTREFENVPAAEPSAPAKPAEAGPKLRRKRRAARRRWDAPAWVVSALIHVGILGGLAAVATTSGDVIKRMANFDTSLGRKDAVDELTKIYADPSDTPRTDTVGDTTSDVVGVGFASNIGAAAPSRTPAVARAGRAIGERTALPTIPSISVPTGLQMMPSMPSRDLGGGGKIGGDVTFEAGEVGVALDQVAREILRHLAQHKVTVVWLFDESESMRDDQKEIRKKFNRVVNELKVNAPAEPADRKARSGTAPPLTHAIVGFGDQLHFEQDKPTSDIEQIGRAIDHLRIDTTGKERTMEAVRGVIAHYGNLISKERKLLIVLVTDESGDDGDGVEEARQAAVSRDVPVYIIGRQSLFGHAQLSIDYVDPVTKDVYRVHINRGPETADVESLQWDGIHTRWDEQPSGFAPYELARLAKDTGGIYFLLPSEEGLRIVQREKAYSISTLKEYVPDYESRLAYAERRTKSEFRRTLYDIIQETRKYPFRHSYSVIPEEMLAQVEEDLPVVTERLNILIAIEKRLRSLEKLRNREPEKRWQAAYDLMLAQIVAYQIKAYEYRANLLEMAAKPPQPKEMPSAELYVQWWLNHSHEMKAPKEKTEKVYAEAMRLFNLVKERHPNTPWADLAQDEINRGFSVHRDEWHHRHTGRYEERRKLVPSF
ncbi:vWA domain-containing protein [Tundrisphaera lichenicola]|uniref:vWA domain-containing protein n=1 Tax=Tundrisphaera lichenicola TaxID=2029860 RepID=UPI003EB7B21A